MLLLLAVAFVGPARGSEAAENTPAPPALQVRVGVSAEVEGSIAVDLGKGAATPTQGQDGASGKESNRVFAVVLTRGKKPPTASNQSIALPNGAEKPGNAKPASSSGPAAKTTEPAPPDAAKVYASLSKLSSDLGKGLTQFGTSVGGTESPAASKPAKTPVDPAVLTAEIWVLYRITSKNNETVDVATCLDDVSKGDFLSTVVVTVDAGQGPGTDSLPASIWSDPKYPGSFFVKLAEGAPGDKRKERSFFVSYRHPTFPWSVTYEIHADDDPPTVSARANVKNPTPYAWSENTKIVLADESAGGRVVFSDANAAMRGKAILGGGFGLIKLSLNRGIHAEETFVFRLPPRGTGENPRKLSLNRGYLLHGSLDKIGLPPGTAEIWQGTSDAPFVISGSEPLAFGFGTYGHRVLMECPPTPPHAQLVEIPKGLGSFDLEINTEETVDLAPQGQLTQVILTRQTSYRTKAPLSACADCGCRKVSLLWLPECQPDWKTTTNNLLVEHVDCHRPLLFTLDENRGLVSNVPDAATAQRLAGAVTHCLKAIRDSREKIAHDEEELGALQKKVDSWSAQPPVCRQPIALYDLAGQYERIKRRQAMHQAQLQKAQLEQDRLLKR